MQEQAVVHEQSTTDAKQQGQQIQQTRINNEDGNQGQSSIKNATQYHNVGVISQNAINNFTTGLTHIYEVVSNKPGFFQFLEAFREDRWASQSEKQGDKSNEEIRENQGVEGHDVEKQDGHLKQVDHQVQIEHLNKTPFFGNPIPLQKPSKSQQTNLPNILSSIIQKISVKHNQAIQQLVHNYSKQQKTSAQSISETIIKRITESIQEMTTNYENIQVMEAMEKSAQQQQRSELKKNTNKIMKIDQDNQFMMEQFGTHQKFQEVQQYVENLKKETVEKYIRENYDQVAKFQFKMREFVDKRSIQMGFEKIKKRSGVTPDNDNDKHQSPSRDNNRVNSGAISQRISSAQSQRLRSAISKNSENDESFNLDLTVKTKNSKNPYQLGKQDSLMYSVDSGFGFQPDSPTKLIKNNENALSNKSAREKKDEIYEQKLENEGLKSGLHKSYSQRVDQHMPQESKPKRIKSSKDKIDQNQALEEDENHDKYQNQGKQNEKQYQEQRNYPEGAEHHQASFKPKYRDYSEEENQQIDIQPKHELQLNQKQMKQVKPTKQLAGKKSKLSQPGERQDRSSIKQGTIIDKMDNFDADDEDEDEKQLHESAHFSKKKSTEQLVRKRVQTEVGKHKKELKDAKSQNYSIKNIKRFNKVDFSKHEEQAATNRQNTEIISHSGSNSNIFATEIEGYHKKISKLKEQKQRKKKELEKELARINYEIKALHQKQQQLSPQNKNNYASRVQISDNNEAQKKAESLVKNLRSQKRNRNLAKLGQFSNLDKNINDYMEELNKFRLENEEKTKQKKKIQILERMKQNQVRKLKEKKKISENQQFVLHLKGVGGPTQPLNVKQEAREQILSKRSPTKQQQEIAAPINITPELSQKKAYLNKIRSFSVKKQKRDPYEQILN